MACDYIYDEEFGDEEEGFQQRPDLAGQLRRNVRARGGTTGRRGRGTGDTGG